MCYATGYFSNGCSQAIDPLLLNSAAAPSEELSLTKNTVQPMADIIAPVIRPK